VDQIKSENWNELDVCKIIDNVVNWLRGQGMVAGWLTTSKAGLGRSGFGLPLPLVYRDHSTEESIKSDIPSTVLICW